MTKTECNGIWVFAEQQNGKLESTAAELLAKAQELKAAVNEDITAVLAGCGIAGLAPELIAHGADRVIVIENPNLANYSTRPFQKAVAEVTAKYKPSIFIFPATVQGRDLAPRVMCQLGTGLTADAIELGFDEDGTFVQTTPAFGGVLFAHISIPECRPQMVTVRAHVFDPLPPDPARKGEVILEKVEVEADPDYEVLEVMPQSFEGKPIHEAEVLVAGGRGIKSEEDIGLLRELAGLLGGEIACSRPLFEQGWLDYRLQIGQSGATVKPKFILNVGISGSIQYVIGMQKSGTVASINTSPRADIFSVSQYGAICDYRTLLPAIIEEIKARKK